MRAAVGRNLDVSLVPSSSGDALRSRSGEQRNERGNIGRNRERDRGRGGGRDRDRDREIAFHLLAAVATQLATPKRPHPELPHPELPSAPLASPRLGKGSL